ncbi:type IX secretion system periplasmic lipoprotein PorW/SprE [Pedobacter montanisoli]|uniref:Tetratricopeptide repeat protein n=1 Tax=Pedobacter montanisoli TaxID=2923277 RepID=A0ABS9ZRT1_9SPHI|nr:tetratricopeptide repeat protein [Pedobacter montanisoli]MCJ0741300.1 tetratricopeptide repeat protein [Pedobacter montanisoli]
MKNIHHNTPVKLVIFCLLLGLFCGCSTQKDTVVNRKLQNLSARYNLIYNSNVLLNDYLEQVTQTTKYDFGELIPIYYAPQPAGLNNEINNKTLDEIDAKARTIIAEKNFSNYIDDAYLLLGKTNFYTGKYFNATEYFNYVANTYKKQHRVRLNALSWQARSYIELGNYEKALQIITALHKETDSVKNQKSDAYATLAQMSIVTRNSKDAINYLQLALKQKPDTKDRIRWYYVLGQLYETEKDYGNSLVYYHKVEKSNAPFEMYFNAKLSKIRINSFLDHKTFDRKKQLATLIKDDKNADFIDQIYYEIAEDSYSSGDYQNAERSYKLSVLKSKGNGTQKGLSYLKIAELNFNQYRDYVKAKLYYDSAVNVLPKTSQQYITTLKKRDNLSYLIDRYELIDREEHLQKIALLPEADRANALASYFESKETGSNNAFSSAQADNNGNSDIIAQAKNSNFYFSNPTALSKGFNEFKRKWGNRKLEDNWRQSIKQNQPVQNLSAQQPLSGSPNALDPDEAAPALKANVIQSTQYLDSLPLTTLQKEKSNQKIIDAYIGIGNFYRQELNDKPEAIKAFESLLNRFPVNNRLDAIYYSLYLAYQPVNLERSNYYKNLVLNKFPASAYAKTIIDPQFSDKQSALENVIKTEYTKVFNELSNKKYKDVISNVIAINNRFPGNNFTPQFEYLKAIAIGHTQSVDSLLTAFNAIVKRYDKDALIKPLVEDHLIYIKANLASYKKRPVALTDYDPNEIPFITNTTTVTSEIPKQENNTAIVTEEKNVAAVTHNAPQALEKKEPVVQAKPVEEKAPAVANTFKDNLFSDGVATAYFYVIAVNSTDFNLSPSRFGIGQFNRGNFTGENLKHQLKELDEDELIFVGDFKSAADVKTYEETIKKQLAVIMKIPAANYTTFVISKENLQKITNRDTLKRYINYINNNGL